MTTTIQDNWYETFFSGLNCEMWERAATPEWTTQEVDFLVKTLQITPEDKILDAPCGFGRHTIELAKLGIEVTGIDISSEFIATLNNQIARKKLKAIQGNLLDFQMRQEFDGAYCLGNSFGYTDYEGMNAFVGNVSVALKTGARFVINSGVVAECILPNFPKANQYVLGDLVMDISNSYFARESYMATEITYTKNGLSEEHSFKHYVYTLSEIIRLLKKHGLATIEVYNSTDMQPFQMGDKQMYLVAEKVS